MLLIENKKLMKEWNWDKNKDLDPNKITYGSHKKVWWNCPKKHSYEMAVNSRTSGSGCYYCSGNRLLKGFNDFETWCHENDMECLLNEWHPTLNGDIKPSDIMKKTGTPYYWICSKNKEHVWTASPHNRSKGTGCPHCSKHLVIKRYRDLQSEFPELANEWHPTLNGKVKPSKVSAKSGKAYYWQCLKNKEHVWTASPHSRTKGNGCPHCSKDLKTSFPEQAIYFYVSKFFKDTYNGFQFIKDKQKYEIDIFIPSLKIGIEYDGYYYHNSEKSKNKDERKNKFLADNGIFLIRIRESGLIKINMDYCKIIEYKRDPQCLNLNEVIKKILKELKICTFDIDIERDRNSILEKFKCELSKGNLKEKFPEVASEWHPLKNGALMPEMFRPYSSQKVWWLCSNCNYEWKIQISKRTFNDYGCPACSKKHASKDYNLKVCSPDLLEFWDYNKNININSTDLLPFDSKVVWWICPKCSKSYQLSVRDRQGNIKCPYCSNRKLYKGVNDFETWCHENNMEYLLEEWHPTKNANTPDNIIFSAKTKRNSAWWLCSHCKKDYQKSINSRIKDKQCPNCNKIRNI